MNLSAQTVLASRDRVVCAECASWLYARLLCLLLVHALKCVLRLFECGKVFVNKLRCYRNPCHSQGSHAPCSYPRCVRVVCLLYARHCVGSFTVVCAPNGPCDVFVCAKRPKKQKPRKQRTTTTTSATACLRGDALMIVIMHGRSRVTIDPRIPTTPGRRTSGSLLPGRHCLNQKR